MSQDDCNRHAECFNVNKMDRVEVRRWKRHSVNNGRMSSRRGHSRDLDCI